MCTHFGGSNPSLPMNLTEGKVATLSSEAILPMNLTEEFCNSSIINEICDVEVLDLGRSKCVVTVG